MKKPDKLYLFLFAVIFGLIVVLGVKVFAQGGLGEQVIPPNPGHSAEAVGAGTFKGAQYSFQNDLTIGNNLAVTGNLFFLNHLTSTSTSGFTYVYANDDAPYYNFLIRGAAGKDSWLGVMDHDSSLKWMAMRYGAISGETSLESTNDITIRPKEESSGTVFVGSASDPDALKVYGDSNVYGNSYVDRDLVVSGTTHAQGNLEVTHKLTANTIEANRIDSPPVSFGDDGYIDLDVCGDIAGSTEGLIIAITPEGEVAVGYNEVLGKTTGTTTLHDLFPEGEWEKLVGRKAARIKCSTFYNGPQFVYIFLLTLDDGSLYYLCHNYESCDDKFHAFDPAGLNDFG